MVFFNFFFACLNWKNSSSWLFVCTFDVSLILRSIWIDMRTWSIFCSGMHILIESKIEDLVRFSLVLVVFIFLNRFPQFFGYFKLLISHCNRFNAWSFCKFTSLNLLIMNFWIVYRNLLRLRLSFLVNNLYHFLFWSYWTIFNHWIGLTDFDHWILIAKLENSCIKCFDLFWIYTDSFNKQVLKLFLSFFSMWFFILILFWFFFVFVVTSRLHLFITFYFFTLFLLMHYSIVFNVSFLVLVYCFWFFTFVHPDKILILFSWLIWRIIFHLS